MFNSFSKIQNFFSIKFCSGHITLTIWGRNWIFSKYNQFWGPKSKPIWPKRYQNYIIVLISDTMSLGDNWCNWWQLVMIRDNYMDDFRLWSHTYGDDWSKLVTIGDDWSQLVTIGAIGDNWWWLVTIIWLILCYGHIHMDRSTYRWKTVVVKSLLWLKNYIIWQFILLMSYLYHKRHHHASVKLSFRLLKWPTLHKKIWVYVFSRTYFSMGQLTCNQPSA